jgi:hypothetical protein
MVHYDKSTLARDNSKMLKKSECVIAIKDVGFGEKFSRTKNYDAKSIDF